VPVGDGALDAGDVDGLFVAFGGELSELPQAAIDKAAATTAQRPNPLTPAMPIPLPHRKAYGFEARL
jgi:hypothetical protein